MASKLRRDRIAERIRDELSEILLQEVSDPRLAGISVSAVKIDRELAYVDIFVSALEGSTRTTEILDGLDRAAGFLRRSLAARIEMRASPVLRFHWDITAERADRIERLIASLHQDEPTKLQSSEGDNAN